MKIDRRLDLLAWVRNATAIKFDGKIRFGGKINEMSIFAARFRNLDQPQEIYRVQFGLFPIAGHQIKKKSWVLGSFTLRFPLSNLTVLFFYHRAQITHDKYKCRRD